MNHFLKPLPGVPRLPMKPHTVKDGLFLFAPMLVVRQLLPCSLHGGRNEALLGIGKLALPS